MKTLDEIKATASGSRILLGWIGSGGVPVSRQKAQGRAFVCEFGDGTGCPMNCEANWWDRIKDSIASFIKDAIALKSSLGMDLVNENRVHMCRACKCCIRLKVWVPIENIKSGVTEDQMKTFPTFCWIRKELNQS